MTCVYSVVNTYLAISRRSQQFNPDIQSGFQAKCRSDRTQRTFYILLASGIFLLLLIWGPVLIRGHSAVISGERYWWLGDDAMISMRYGEISRTA